MKLARRRHRGLGNPVNSSDLSTTFKWLGGGALVGAGLGALTYRPVTSGALGGAYAGVAIVGVGGIVVAVVSAQNRSEGIATAGIGLGGLALLGLVQNIAGGVTKPVA